MNELGIEILVRLIMCLLGGVEIAIAVEAFYREKYFLFGFSLMVAVSCIKTFWKI